MSIVSKAEAEAVADKWFKVFQSLSVDEQSAFVAGLIGMLIRHVGSLAEGEEVVTTALGLAVKFANG